MRTFHRRERYPITKENEIATFQGELDYYRTHNTFPVTLFGKQIVNIYKNINIQVVVSKVCNLKCPFCIENDAITNVNAECGTDYVLDRVISAYLNTGICPCVSITGGEPTLFPDRLRNIYDIVYHKHGIPRVNINTNGTNPEILQELKYISINLSRHHYCDTKADAIFGKKTNCVIGDNTTMQCVMMKGYIDSVAEIKKYMDFYTNFYANGFSFRGMSKLDVGKQYEKEVDFSAAHAVDFFKIVEEVSNDPDFQFVQQKIGDHYWFEIYKYKGKPVRFTYSNFEFLRKVETEERRRGKWFSRATIILPNSKVYAGWTYDINEIATVPHPEA